MAKTRLTETQRIILRCSTDDMVVGRRKDTMLKLIALGLVTPVGATMAERLKVGHLTSEGRRIKALCLTEPDRCVFDISPGFSRVRIVLATEA